MVNNASEPVFGEVFMATRFAGECCYRQSGRVVDRLGPRGERGVQNGGGERRPGPESAGPGRVSMK
jgi:hypothetical protein